MTTEEARLELERERLTLEREKFERESALEERKYHSDVAAKKWSQLATFVPILALVIGFYLSQALESSKKTLELAVARHTQKIQTIDRQKYRLLTVSLPSFTTQ